MPDLSRPDASLWYEVSGSGPPLLLIAGMFSDSASWAPLMPLLEPHFMVIRPDNRSTGRTSPWNAPCNVEVWAQDCHALLTHLDVPKAHVFGHSMGGMIGWYLAQLAPERVWTLQIAGSAPLKLERNVSLFKALVDNRTSKAPPDNWLRLLHPWLFHPSFFENPDAVNATVAASLAYEHAQTAEAMAHQIGALSADIDYTPLMSPPSVPTRAILAKDDLLVPLEPAAASLSLLDVTTIVDAGHAMHWDQPNIIADLIRAFAKDPS